MYIFDASRRHNYYYGLIVFGFNTQSNRPLNINIWEIKNYIKVRYKPLF
jgi:hypothetical protein